MPIVDSQLDIMAALEIAIEERLKGWPEIALMVEQAVYNQSVQPGQSYPYILYQYIRGGEENSSPRLSIDVEYLACGVSDDYTTALRLSAHIQAAMTTLQLPLPYPYKAHWVSRDTWYNRKRFISNSQEWQIGGFYGIKAHLTGEIDRRVISYGS